MGLLRLVPANGHRLRWLRCSLHAVCTAGLCRPPGTTGAPGSHREPQHVPPAAHRGEPPQETGQGLPLVIPADTVAGLMGTEPPPAAQHGTLRGTGQRQGWLLSTVLGTTWLLHRTSELQALSPSRCSVPALQRSQRHRDIVGEAAQAQESKGGLQPPGVVTFQSLLLHENDGLQHTHIREV